MIKNTQYFSFAAAAVLCVLWLCPPVSGAAEVPSVSHVGITVENQDTSHYGRIRALVTMTESDDAETGIPVISDAVRNFVPMSGAVAAGNDAVIVQADTGGEFSISSGGGRNILYAGPWGFSGQTVLKIDGAVHDFGGPDGDWTEPVAGNGIRIAGVRTIGDVKISVSLAPRFNPMSGKDDLISVTYSFENNGSGNHVIGLKKLLDTMTGDNDSAPVGAGDGYSLAEREFSGGDIPQYWYSFEDGFGPDQDAYLTVGILCGHGMTAPDRFVIGDWSRLSGPSWDYTPSGTFTDSALALWWDDMMLAPGGRIDITLSAGLSSSVVLSAESACMTLIGDKQLGALNGSVSPSPFTVTCLIYNCGTEDIGFTDAGLTPADGLAFAGGEEPQQRTDPIPPGVIHPVTWRLLPLESSYGDSGSYTVSVQPSFSDVALTVRETVAIPAPEISSGASVTAAEAFIDSDPGQGQGTTLRSADGVFDNSAEIVLGDIVLDGLEAGYHSLFVRGYGDNGTRGDTRAYRFRIPQEQYDGPRIVLDSDLGRAQSQGKSSLHGLAAGDRAGFAIYIDNAEAFRSFDIDFSWDDQAVAFVEYASGISVDEGVDDINGVDSLEIAGEPNIADTGGAAIAVIPGSSEPGHYLLSAAKMGGEPVTAPRGLLYFAVFAVLDSFDIANDSSIEVRVTLADDTGVKTPLPPVEFIFRPSDEYRPPENVTVSDVPGDHGHQLDINWSLSPDDPLLEGYRIYRSRSPEFTNYADISMFASLDELIAAEERAAVLAGAVPAGTGTFRDSTVPLNSGYYYWIESYSGSGVARTAAMSFMAAPAAVGDDTPSAFKVFNPRPNPFNSVTTLSYNLPEAGIVRMEVYDILGRKVSVPCEEFQSAGMHTIIWNGESTDGVSVSAGVYLYRIICGRQMHGGKLLFVK